MIDEDYDDYPNSGNPKLDRPVGFGGWLGLLIFVLALGGLSYLLLR